MGFQVKYNQRGYTGHSMSNRAVWAYEAGERPLSKFRKEDIEHINALIGQHTEHDLALTLKQGKELLSYYGCSSWHHTGKYGNKTYFYHLAALFGVDGHEITEDWYEDLTEGDIETFRRNIDQFLNILYPQLIGKDTPEIPESRKANRPVGSVPFDTLETLPPTEADRAAAKKIITTFEALNHTALLCPDYFGYIERTPREEALFSWVNRSARRVPLPVLLAVDEYAARLGITPYRMGIFKKSWNKLSDYHFHERAEVFLKYSIYEPGSRELEDLEA